LKFAVFRYPHDTNIWFWIPNYEWLVSQLVTKKKFEFCMVSQLNTENLNCCLLCISLIRVGKRISRQAIAKLIGNLRYPRF
jgi:hypothetical protein